MRDIAALRQKWWAEAKDKMDNSVLFCKSLDGSCDYRKGGEHSPNCSLVRAIRENEKFANYQRQV